MNSKERTTGAEEKNKKTTRGQTGSHQLENLLDKKKIRTKKYRKKKRTDDSPSTKSIIRWPSAIAAHIKRTEEKVRRGKEEEKKL